MTVAVLKERRAGETRVAATPETVKKLIGMGCTLAVEAGAGLASGFTDAAFAEAGASLAADAAGALAGAASGLPQTSRENVRARKGARRLAAFALG